MNGIEKITEKIISDAEVYRSSVIKTAEEESAALLAKYQAEADDIAAKGEGRAKERAAALLSRAESSADKEGKNILLACRAALLDRAFADAKTSLPALDGGEYASLLVSLVKNAVINQLCDAKILAENDEDYCEPEEFVISLNESDREKFGRDLVDAALSAGAKKASLGENIAARGGVVVTFGDIITNCLTDDLTDGARSSLEPGVAEILFKGKKQ